MWLLEIKSVSGDPNSAGEKRMQKMSWDRGFMYRKGWASQKQVVSKNQKLMTWSRICVKHGGEELTLSAMQRSEVKKVRNPDFNDKPGCQEPQYMYKMVSHEGP